MRVRMLPGGPPHLKWINPNDPAINGTIEQVLGLTGFVRVVWDDGSYGPFLISELEEAP